MFMLGRFAVERDGRVIPQAAWKRKRPIELLTGLVLASGRVLHREEIIDRLWPDKDLDAGANNLYRALHDLRHLPPGQRSVPGELCRALPTSRGDGDAAVRYSRRGRG